MSLNLNSNYILMSSMTYFMDFAEKLCAFSICDENMQLDSHSLTKKFIRKSSPQELMSLI